jgi:peptidoglycan hydrolase CwlO-like protein
MSAMVGAIVITIIVLASVTAVTLGSVWMGTSYSAKKRGFAQGTTRRELEQIQSDIAQIQKDIADLKEQIADLIIVTKGAT